MLVPLEAHQCLLYDAQQVCVYLQPRSLARLDDIIARFEGGTQI